jgi:regulator of cell morphogenesis and NO signaling
MPINAMNTVREVAVSIPGATGIFERAGIDYCCRGDRSLADACEKSGVPVEDVVRGLEEAANRNKIGEFADWQKESLAALCAHIVGKHHVYTRGQLEQAERLVEKVCAKHATLHPELHRLQDLVNLLRDDLNPHMLKEEQVLFPYIGRLEDAARGGVRCDPAFFGTVQNPIRMMMTEHEAAGEVLEEMRALTLSYSPPADACLSYQALYSTLHELEKDLHQHIHLENNHLFPRAIAMESQVHPESKNSTGKQQCFGR